MWRFCQRWPREGRRFISDTQDHNYKTVDKERKRKFVSPNHKNKTISLHCKTYGPLKRKCWLSRGYGSKSFDSFVLCAVSSLNTKTFGWISRQSRRYSSIPCCFLPRNLVLVFRVFRPAYACNDIVDAQLFFISFYSGDEPKETSVEVDNPEADPVEKDDENGKAF